MSARNMFYSKDHKFSNEEDREYAREELVYNVTEDLLVIMEDMGINKKELADKLGKSRAYITQILSGTRNMTLGTFSDICFALGFKPEIALPVQEEQEKQEEFEYLDIPSYKTWTSNISKKEIENNEALENSHVIDIKTKKLWSREAA